MENPSSPLDTLRQLKEMLDAGALTPTEFEALKQRLVLTPLAATTAAAAEVVPPLVAPAALTPNATAPAPALPAPEALPPVPGYEATAEFAPEAAENATPAFAQAPVRAFPPAAAAGVAEDTAYALNPEAEVLTDDDAALPAAPAERNSSLGLVLAIAGVLVFLAVVAYLGFTRPTTDEHLTSISQTAADSANTAIETGPQVAPLPTATAAPETVRVAPTNPAPALPARVTTAPDAAARRDSAAPVVSPAAADSAVRQ